MKFGLTLEFAIASKSLRIFGGDDGARTRDLCRDRVATSMDCWSYKEARGAVSHGKEYLEFLLCPRFTGFIRRQNLNTLTKLGRAGTRSLGLCIFTGNNLTSPVSGIINGLRPATLRLTAPLLVFSGLLRTALSCSLSAIYVAMMFHIRCGDSPEFATILRGVPHKIPHSFCPPKSPFLGKLSASNRRVVDVSISRRK